MGNQAPCLSSNTTDDLYGSVYTKQSIMRDQAEQNKTATGDVDAMNLMRSFQRRETVGLIDRTYVLDDIDDVDSDGNPVLGVEDSDEASDEEPVEYSSSIPFIEFCVKTQIFLKETKEGAGRQLRYNLLIGGVICKSWTDEDATWQLNAQVE